MKHHQIHDTNNVTYLGLSFDEHLNWTNHVQRIVCKANCANGFYEETSPVLFGLRKCVI